jgi:hypothetical protein
MPKPRKPTIESETPAGRQKVRVSVWFTTEAAERLRDAAWWTRISVTDLAEEAINEKVAKLERKHGAFKRRQGEIKTGRRPKVPD